MQKKVSQKSKKGKASKPKPNKTTTINQVKQVVKDEVKKVAKSEADKALKAELKKMEKMDGYDHGEALIKLLNSRFDFKANSGQAVAFDFNITSYALLVNCWIDRMMATTPISVSTTSANPIWPVDLAMLAWMAAILHIRETGQLTGDTLGLIPQFTKDIDLPVSLASFLQYLGKYVRHDQNYVTKFTLPTNFMNATINFGELDPLKVYPFPVYNGGLCWDLLKVAGMGELAADRSWVPMTVGTWCTTRLFTVVNSLKSLNLPVVPMEQIPKSAPGAEAYACRGIDQLSAAVIPNRVYSMVLPVDWEIAAIFSLGRNRVVQQTWRSATISAPTFDPGVVYATLTTEHVLASGMMFLLTNQNEYKSGPVKAVYRLGKSRLNTFVWNVKYVSGTSFRQQLGIAYNQIQQQVLGFSDLGTGFGWRILYSLHVIAALHLHHRCELNSPVTQQALRLAPNLYSASAFYNQGASDQVSIPSNIAEFIESVGTVIADGAMVFPFLKSPPGSASTTWNDPSFAGNMIEMSWKGLNYATTPVSNNDFYPFPWRGNTTDVPNVNTGQFIWDTTFEANYTAVFPNVPYPIQHPQFTVDSFMNIWKAATATQHFNSIAMAMVSTARMREIRFGEAYQMLSIASGLLTRRVSITPTNQLFTATNPTESKKTVDGKEVGAPAPPDPLFVDVPTTTYVGSSLILNRAELLQATIIPSSIGTIDIQGATSTFLCKMTGANTLLMLEDVVNKTLQSGMTLAAPTQESVKQLPGGEIVPVKPTDNVKKVSAWDQVVHEAGSKLVPPVVGTAAGIACDFIPIIGALVSPLCASGAAALATMLTSRSTVTSQHLTDASSTNSVKAHLQSIRPGIQKLGNAVAASRPAIDQATSIVNKFALAQVKGIGYANLHSHALALRDKKEL